VSTLTENYCIVGVGETAYTRGAGRSTRAMAAEAIQRAMADAGLERSELDGLMSYQSMDSTFGSAIATDLGIRLNFNVDIIGGGSSAEALVGMAIGVLEVGMCDTIAIFRSMLGYSGVRMGGSGARAVAPVSGPELLARTYGWSTPAQYFAPFFMRHMMEYGTTGEQAAHVKSFQSMAASNNPKALYKNRVSVDDVLESRWIVKPLHLLDCCTESDNATALIITRADRAKHLRQTPIHVMGVAGRVAKPHADYGYNIVSAAYGPITQVAGYYAKDVVFGMAGVKPDDVDVTGTYDCFTYVSLMQLEEYGFCEKGDGGAYVSSGVTALGGRKPNNTSGGQLCEGYTHGLSLIIENVRQLRRQADDYCDGCHEGKHTYDYSEGGCRQVKDPEIAMNMGWLNPSRGSALILRN
jgi:acetyl-CoA acetyltransferase